MLLGSVYISFFQDAGAGNAWQSSLITELKIPHCRSSSWHNECCAKRDLWQRWQRARPTGDQKRGTLSVVYFHFLRDLAALTSLKHVCWSHPRWEALSLARRVATFSSFDQTTMQLSGSRSCVQSGQKQIPQNPRVPDAPGPERIMSVTCEDLEVTNGSAGFS